MIYFFFILGHGTFYVNFTLETMFVSWCSVLADLKCSRVTFFSAHSQRTLYPQFTALNAFLFVMTKLPDTVSLHFRVSVQVQEAPPLNTFNQLKYQA